VLSSWVVVVIWLLNTLRCEGNDMLLIISINVERMGSKTRGYFEEDVLFTYDTLQRRSHFYKHVADSIHMLQRRSGLDKLCCTYVYRAYSAGRRAVG